MKYLAEELNWPTDEFDFDEITFDWDPEELGLERKAAAKIDHIKQLRPLENNQTWGIFFVKFAPKRLPMVAMRRILNKLVLKKRASAQPADRAAWKMRDLLFISQYGEGDERKISFAQFADNESGNLPVLKVLAWGETQTPLTLEAVDQKLRTHLSWPDDPSDSEVWHKRWSAAFTHRDRHAIRTSKELAVELADLARAIFDEAERILEIENENGPLTKLYKAFQQALIHDLEPTDFADMYAQTITYGLFSTAVSGTDTTFGQGTFVNTERMVQLVPNTNPFLREMLSTFLTAGGEKEGLNFDELGINEVVDVLNDPKTDLPAIIREFGAKKKDEDPVIHFYEEFLKAYNAKLRFQRGVFYTPQPVVSYIVRSVHELLQTEFGLEDGLADTTTWGEMVERWADPQYKLDAQAASANNDKDANANESESRQPLTIPDGMTADDPFVQILDPATGTATFLVEVIDVIHKTMLAKWQKAGKNDAQCKDAWNEYVPQHLLPRVYGYELMMAPYAIAHMKIGLKLTETGYRFGSNARAKVFLTNAVTRSTLENQSTLGDWFPALAQESVAVAEVKKMIRFAVILGNPPYSSSAGVSQNPFLDKAMQSVMHGLGVENERKKGALQDEYIRFVAVCRLLLEETGIGVLGLITNNSYLDGTLHRSLRQSLIRSFDFVNVVDLHGSTRASKTKLPDENVFDIIQGVALFIGGRGGRQSRSSPICFSELIGTRKQKYKLLNVGSLKTQQMQPREPYFLLSPLDSTDFDEYQSFTPLDEIFSVYSSGIETEKDHFAVAMDRTTLEGRLRDFVGASSDAEIKSRYKLKSTANWDLEESRVEMRDSGIAKGKFTKYAFRCFDFRFTYYDDALITRSRKTVMSHMTEVQNNVALVSMRQVKGEQYAHAFATDSISNKFTLSSKSSNVSYHFPLLLKPEKDGLLKSDAASNIRTSYLRNFNPSLNAENEKDFAPKVFSWIYAILHSPTYRERYGEFLTLGFARIPSTNRNKFFESLASLGHRLLGSHLLSSSPKSRYLEFNGKAGQEIEKVTRDGDRICISKDQSVFFSEVPDNLWDFYIGGYKPVQKWLKDRQAKGGKNPRPGRKLTKEDIEHYQKMVVAIRETIRLMGEIDEVIDQHGGWPDAFVTEPLETTDGDSPTQA